MIETGIAVVILTLALAWGEYRDAHYKKQFKKTHDELTSVLIEIRKV